MTIAQFTTYLARHYPFRMWLIVSAGVASNLLEGIGLALLAPMFSLAGMGTASATGAPSRIGSLIEQGARSLGLELTLGSTLMTLLVVFLLQSLVVMLGERLTHGTRHQFAGTLRTTLYDAIFAARWEFIAKQKTGVLMNALTQDPVRADAAFLNLVALAREGTAILIYVVLALIFSWQMTLAAMAIAGAGLYLLSSRVGKGQGYGTKTTLANSLVHEEAVEKLSCAKLVKSFAEIEEVSKRFKSVVQGLVDIQVGDSKNRAMVGALYQPLTAAFLLSGLYLALTFLQMSLPDVMVLLIVFFRLTPRLSALQMLLHDVTALLPSMANIVGLIREAEKHRECDGGMPFRGMCVKAEMRDVWFAYENKEPILRGVNLEFHKGEMIAIVGISGGGKTTIIDLIMGLLRPSQGEVLIDGVPLHRLSLKDWHSHIGYVPQEVNLFNDTVQANLLWGKPTATFEEIKSAARQAHAEEFIRGLPQGYDTVVGSRGVLLSGGQRQRLALARALIRKPELLILDEATSALDTESETMIQQTLEALARSMSMVVVAHRLATVQRADRIYVLEEGRIVESGSWEALALAGGRFNGLRRLQALT